MVDGEIKAELSMHCKGLTLESDAGKSREVDKCNALQKLQTFWHILDENLGTRLFISRSIKSFFSLAEPQHRRGKKGEI